MKMEILAMDRIAVKLREDRFKKGSIGFETDEVKIKLDEEDKPIEMSVKEIVATQRDPGV